MPLYVKFTLDNYHRESFHKLAVKSEIILSLVYNKEAIGIVYLNKESKIKILSLEKIDLSNNKIVDKPITKKFRIG